MTLARGIMRHVLPSFVFLLGALGLSRGSQERDDVAAAGEMFRERCIHCHVPPDPAFEVDRAWLNQVKDTA